MEGQRGPGVTGAGLTVAAARIRGCRMMTPATGQLLKEEGGRKKKE